MARQFHTGLCNQQEIAIGSAESGVDCRIANEYISSLHCTLMRRIYDFGVIHYFIKDEGSLNGTYIVTMLGKESKVGAQWVQIPLLASIKIGRILIPWGNGA